MIPLCILIRWLTNFLQIRTLFISNKSQTKKSALIQLHLQSIQISPNHLKLTKSSCKKSSSKKWAHPSTYFCNLPLSYSSPSTWKTWLRCSKNTRNRPNKKWSKSFYNKLPKSSTSHSTRNLNHLTLTLKTQNLPKTRDTCHTSCWSQSIRTGNNL